MTDTLLYLVAALLVTTPSPLATQPEPAGVPPPFPTPPFT